MPSSEDEAKSGYAGVGWKCRERIARVWYLCMWSGVECVFRRNVCMYGRNFFKGGRVREGGGSRRVYKECGYRT